MDSGRWRRWLALAAIAIGAASIRAQQRSDVFEGSTPAEPSIRQVLGIPATSKIELIQWKLVLSPSRYELQARYGRKRAGRQGAWRIGKGTPSNPDAVVYELDGAPALAQIDANILHLLNPDRTLMVGDGGYSYTLNRVERAETLVAPALARAQPDMSYSISPLSTGPLVFGVFEGRSPCHGIAQRLNIAVDAACTKSKWRVTLYQDPRTRTPTTYKVEGSLHRTGAREGTWSFVQGTPGDPRATVYRLAPTDTEPAMLLLKGDDNVLFVLDQDGTPLVGHRDFSYTLNRRAT
jgi:hypothetical protein